MRKSRVTPPAKSNTLLAYLQRVEIRKLKSINADLLEACEYAVNYLPDGHRFAKEKLQQAINKAKGE